MYLVVGLVVLPQEHLTFFNRKICNLISFWTIITTTTSVYKKLEKIEQLINEQRLNA